MVVSRTIFTGLKFILPRTEERVSAEGHSDRDPLIPLPFCFLACTLFRETCPGKLAGRGPVPELPSTTSSTSTGGPGTLQAGREEEGKLWGEPQEAA